MRRKGNRRVWYIHHAESESLYKTYSHKHAREAAMQMADILNNESYLIWKKKYGHDKENVFEETRK